MISAEDKLFLQIHDYLNGDLMGEEKKLFEENLKTNPSLQEVLEFQELANTLVINNRLLDVSKTSQKAIFEIKQKNKIKKGSLLFGVIGILIGIVVFYIKDEKTYSIEKNSPQNNEDTTSEIKSTIPDKELDSIQIETKEKITTKREVSKVETVEKIIILPKDSVVEEKTIEKQPSIPIINQFKTENEVKIEKETKINCSFVDIAIKTEVFAACNDEKDGKIEIIEIKGGEKPYSTEIFDTYKNKVNSSNFLLAGKYQLIIRDKNNCEKSLFVVVPEKKCESIDAVFNPFIGETWELNEYDKNGIITIYQKNGQILFEQRVKAFEKFNWNGQDLHGQIKDGYYIFVFTFEDASIIKGEITVTK